jgi:hypothetical protein
MDYSIFKALNFNMEGIESALISYDVMCQWSVHMRERVNGSNYLNLPDNLDVTFHLGLVVFRERSIRTIIGTVFVHISYFPHARCVMSCVVSCVGHVLCCALLRCSTVF